MNILLFFLTVTFENVCRVHTKRQVIIKMNKFNMFITAVCVLFLIKHEYVMNILLRHENITKNDVMDNIAAFFLYNSLTSIYIKPLAPNKNT